VIRFALGHPDGDVPLSVHAVDILADSAPCIPTAVAVAAGATTAAF